MFRNRAHTGKVLAGRLGRYRGQAETVLLAIPRGGVAVAAAAAEELMLPLDVLPVRKLGAPHQPELGIGAIANGLMVVDRDAITKLGVSQSQIDQVVGREQAELARREREYRGELPPLVLTNQTVILIDDGLATGYTMLAAVRAVRRRKPRRVVVAVPVAASEAVEWLQPEVDELVCPYVTRRLVAIGLFYDDFAQISDEQVRNMLQAARASRQLEEEQDSVWEEAPEGAGFVGGDADGDGLEERKRRPVRGHFLLPG
jgi:predicted phosphoribosyltransferase